MTFPNTYPAKPPDVRFVNRIHHCNINSQGKVCHSILDRNWNPARSARDVINCIYGLLLTPEPDDPLDSTIAEEYYADKAAFEQNARDLVGSCASEEKTEMERRMARELPDEVTPPPSHVPSYEAIDGEAGTVDCERPAIRRKGAQLWYVF